MPRERNNGFSKSGRALYDRPKATKNDPFRSGASVYIADSEKGMGWIARFAAQSAADYFVSSMKAKLERQPQRHGRTYWHPKWGEYRASAPGGEIESEYPAWFTGDLHDSIGRAIMRNKDGAEYQVGSSEPHAYWLMNGWTRRNLADGRMLDEGDPRPFLLRNAIEELETIERILAHPFLNIGKKGKRPNQKMTREEIFRIMEDGTWASRPEIYQGDASMTTDLLESDPTTKFSRKLKVTVQEWYDAH